MGTLDYMPPEQFADARVDQRADVYSLGCTLYRLLTNHRPYPMDAVVSIYCAHLESPIPSLRTKRPETSKQLDAVFQKMLAKQPGERQASMAEVISDLEGCLGPQHPPTPVIMDLAEDDIFDGLFEDGVGEPNPSDSHPPATPASPQPEQTLRQPAGVGAGFAAGSLAGLVLVIGSALLIWVLLGGGRQVDPAAVEGPAVASSSESKTLTDDRRQPSSGASLPASKPEPGSSGGPGSRQPGPSGPAPAIPAPATLDPAPKVPATPDSTDGADQPPAAHDPIGGAAGPDSADRPFAGASGEAGADDGTSLDPGSTPKPAIPKAAISSLPILDQDSRQKNFSACLPGLRRSSSIRRTKSPTNST